MIIECIDRVHFVVDLVLQYGESVCGTQKFAEMMPLTAM